MGLDMYLHREIYMPLFDMDDGPEGYFTKGRKKAIRVLKALGERPLIVGASVTVSVPAAYWRKANAIHAWFVRELAEGVDECQDIAVTRGDLDKLLTICRDVLADRSKASELLPSQDGFFFGTTEYESWYFDSIEDTVQMLENAITAASEAGDNNPLWTYRASW